MFEIIEKTANRLDITIKGQIDAEEMRTSLDALFAKSDGIQGGVMLYRISDFSIPTLGALGVEMTQLPQLFGLIGKFKKCAVLTDAAWIRKAAEVEGVLIPGLMIKGFDVDDEAGAEAWLAADP